MSADPRFAVVIDVALGDAMRRVEERITSGEASSLAELGGWLGRMGTLLSMRIVGLKSATVTTDDRVLEVEDVAQRLGQSKSWVYAHRDALGEIRIPMPGVG